jgi:hypothetical protein
MSMLISVKYYFTVDRFDWKNRLTYLAFVLTFIGLAFPTVIYDLFNKSAWERDVVTVTAGLTFAMLAVTYLAHMLPLAKPSTSDVQKLPSAAHERVV